ncbi:MAG: GNAT family N-acetyltransferase [Sulfitobacter sp.]
MFDAMPTTPSHALMQDPAFAAALRLCGEDPITLPSGLLLLNRRLAGVPVLMLPRAAPPPDLPKQLADAGLSRRLLILSPEHPCKMPRALRMMPRQALLRVDLSGDDQTRRAGLHQKWRNQLRRAEGSLLRVTQRRMNASHPMLARAAEQSRARRYQGWPTALTAAFAKAAPEQTQIFTALLRGHPVAHMLFLIHGNRATYHIGHTTPEGRKTHAHNLLLWQASIALHRAGIMEMDLGPETTPQIDRFKCRAGAQQVMTGGTWLRWAPF